MTSSVVYPVELTPCGNGGFSVWIPDIDQYTQGESIADAICMARDLLGTMSLSYADDGLPMPEPFSTVAEAPPDSIHIYVDVDFEAYREEYDTRLVKKNCTIPYYLEAAASKKGLNFSRVLTEALAEKLDLPLKV